MDKLQILAGTHITIADSDGDALITFHGDYNNLIMANVVLEAIKEDFRKESNG